MGNGNLYVSLFNAIPEIKDLDASARTVEIIVSVSFGGFICQCKKGNNRFREGMGFLHLIRFFAVCAEYS